MIKLKFRDYRVTNDSNQIILSKVIRTADGAFSIRKDGEEARRTLGYFALDKPKHVLKAIERDMIYNGETDITSIKELSQHVNALIDRLDESTDRILNSLRNKGE